MSIDDASWQPLRCEGLPDELSLLLIRSSFSSDSYAIQVTDLGGSLWNLEANKRQIFKQSLNDETSLDASESSANLRKLLEKIEEALAGADNTTCRHVSHSKTYLHLEILASLGEGWNDLVWNLRLDHTPSLFTSNFVLPLLRSTYAQQRSTESLIKQLKEKDHVIDSVCTRLEASGMDVSAVFPGVTTTKRQLPEAHIKGLKPFNESQWRKSLSSHDFNSVSINEMIVAVASSITGGSTSQATSTNAATRNGSSSSRKQTSAIATPRKPKKEAAPEDRPAAVDEAHEDDDFQRQSTPPSLKKRKDPQRTPPDSSNTILVKPSGQASTDEDGTTDDDDGDLDAPVGSKALTQRSPGTAPPPKASHPALNDAAAKRKLGMIGGRKKQPSKEPAPSPPPSVAPRDATEDEDDGDLDAPVQKPAPSSLGPPAPEASAPKKHKLGIIGGKKKDQYSTVTTASASDNDAEGSSKDGKYQITSSVVDMLTNPAIKDEPNSRPSTANAEEDPLKSSQERADDRRAELKRQLEDSKSKPAVKKKRKF